MIPLAALGLLLTPQAKPVLQERMTMSSGTVVHVGRRSAGRLEATKLGTIRLGTSKAGAPLKRIVLPLSGDDMGRILLGSAVGTRVAGGPVKFTASAMAIPGVGAMTAAGGVSDADPSGDGSIWFNLDPRQDGALSFLAQSPVEGAPLLVVVNLKVYSGAAKVSFFGGASLKVGPGRVWPSLVDAQSTQEAVLAPGEDHVAFFLKAGPTGQFSGILRFETEEAACVGVSSVQVQPYK